MRIQSFSGDDAVFLFLFFGLNRILNVGSFEGYCAGTVIVCVAHVVVLCPALTLIQGHSSIK